MALTNTFITSENRTLSDGKQALISQDLDSVRKYGWEIIFQPPVNGPGGAFNRPLTLAAKAVGEAGMALDDIEVNRVNDKVFYPGKATPTELVVTFDNLFATKTGPHLWEWFKTIYDPTTGEFTPLFLEGASQGVFKTQIDILQLNGAGQPFTHQKYYGCYPKDIKWADKDYADSAFDQITVSFRFDFMDQLATV